MQPLLVVFENLHWLDSESQAFLDSLVDSLPLARALVLVSYRPEYQHGWARKSYYTQFRIDPLPPQSSEELLHALMGDDPGLGALKQLLIERTEGNPFFIEESVRTLAETKVLAGTPGHYRLTREVQKVQVPATVQAVLAARIDRLPIEGKRLLQAAAVIGKDVPMALLQEIADLSEETVRRNLALLQSGEFLYEISLFPSVEYTFRHALTHEVAYSSLLQDRRRALHGRVVQAMEQLYADRLPEHFERLAHHAVRGEVWTKAVAYLRQAGTKAAARSANREAVIFFEQAMSRARAAARGAARHRAGDRPAARPALAAPAARPARARVDALAGSGGDGREARRRAAAGARLHLPHQLPPPEGRAGHGHRVRRALPAHR